MKEILRKAQIAQSLADLITNNMEWDVSLLLGSVFRRKNFNNSTTSLYNFDVSDEELSKVLENMLKELKETKEA